MLIGDMEYSYDFEVHILSLTEGETDELFDPFDARDKDMPSHLYHAGHRYIKQEPYDWLIANVGQPYQGWQILSRSTRNRKDISFSDKEHAMLFKLTFAGSDHNV
jgi:hypothetical protein